MDRHTTLCESTALQGYKPFKNENKTEGAESEGKDGFVVVFI